MFPIRIKGVVRDGHVETAEPIDLPDGFEVTITGDGPKRMSQEEWRTAVMATAGCIDDPTFVRPPQGEVEVRDPMP